MALTAARRGERPVVCVPCAVRYYYTEDPTPELLDVMARLEEAMFWRVRPEMPLEKRIYRVAEGILGLKELEYLGQMEQGTLPDRIHGLSHAILARLEDQYGIDATTGTIPDRVKALRQKVIARREELDESDPRVAACDVDMDDLYLVIQSFSYPGDYVVEKPTIERLAETIDKFEEDILGSQTATIRGARRATVSFGEPLEVPAEKRKDGVAQLSHTLEQRVQELLDTTPRPPGCCSDTVTLAPPASATEAGA
jgi:hypothetical protein